MGGGRPIDLIAEGQQMGRVPDWVRRERPSEGSREAIQERFHNTEDIAGSAEALCEEGSITYDQTSTEDISHLIDGVRQAAGHDPRGEGVTSAMREAQAEMQGSYIGTARPDQVLQATRGNCYEFVHFAAWLAGRDGARWHYGNSLRGVIDPKTIKKWDFRSPIPRGQVIVGCLPGVLGGQGSDGTFHFAVSLGDGMVANNRGQGVQRERLEDVFGGSTGSTGSQGMFNPLAIFGLWSSLSAYRVFGEVYYGDYACYAPKDEVVPVAPEETPATPPPQPKVPNPSSAPEQRRIGAAGAGGGGLALLLLLLFAPECLEPTGEMISITPPPLPPQVLCEPQEQGISHNEVATVKLRFVGELGPDEKAEWEVGETDSVTFTPEGIAMLELAPPPGFPGDFSAEPAVGARQVWREGNTVKVTPKADGPNRTQTVTLTIKTVSPVEVSTTCHVHIRHVGPPLHTVKDPADDVVITDHKVGPQDTIESIAARYGKTPDELRAHLRQHNISPQLKPGQVIPIPGGTGQIVSDHEADIRTVQARRSEDGIVVCVERNKRKLSWSSAVLLYLLSKTAEGRFLPLVLGQWSLHADQLTTGVFTSRGERPEGTEVTADSIGRVVCFKIPDNAREGTTHFIAQSYDLFEEGGPRGFDEVPDVIPIPER